MDEKKMDFNEKQRLKYQNNLEFRQKKQQLARQYYQNKKYGNFEITFSNEPKKLSFQ